MATSGSTNFAAQRNDILRQAALNVAAIGVNDTMSAEKLADFSFVLNAMVKAWGETGVHVWTEKEATLFPAAGQVSYGIGGSATDHVTESYVQTAITAAEALGQTVLSIDDVSGITAADHIGIQLDDGTLFWTTVQSVGATTVTVVDPITDSAAAGNYVFAYTSRIVRPLKILDLRRYDIASATDTPLGPPIARRDYMDLPRKTTTGVISQGWYDQQNTTGHLKLWQPPAIVTELVNFTWCKPIEDFDAASDEADLPQGWISTLIWNLSRELASGRYPVAQHIYLRIVERAEDTFDQVSSFDREGEGSSVFMQPVLR